MDTTSPIKHNYSFSLLYKTKEKKTFLSSEQTLFKSCVSVHHSVSKGLKTQASKNFPQRSDEPAEKYGQQKITWTFPQSWLLLYVIQKMYFQT